MALALLFSCFTSPFLAILFTVGLYVTGLFAGDLRTVRGLRMDPSTLQFTRGISYLLPNFQNFDVMAPVVHGQGVPASFVWNATVYALLYTAIVLAGAAAVFSRRNLK